MLRDYQVRIINDARQELRKFKNIAIYAPTAAGKSWIAAEMAISSAKRGFKVLICTHREEILRQNLQKMELMGATVQVVSSKQRNIPSADIVCCMSQTLSVRCKTKPGWMEFLHTIDFLIVDEMHRAEHDYIVLNARDGIYLVGLSATILRSGTMRQLGSMYSSIVCSITTKELIDKKYIVPARYFEFQAPKLDGVSIDSRTGDYVQHALQKRFRKPERYVGIKDNFKRICPERKFIVFTTGSQHCVELCQSFNDSGIKTKYLLSKPMEQDKAMSGERKALLSDFANGVFQGLVTVEMLSTGFDEPSVSCLIYDVSTKSYVKYIQTCGRGCRLHDGKKDFLVLDFGANRQEHGFFDDPPANSLWHDKSKGGVAPTKECPECHRLVPVQVIDCPYCKYHWITSQEAYEVELTEVTKKDPTDLKGWVAQKILEGWPTNRILVTIMMKNKDDMKRAFMDAIQIMRTKDGNPISPQYYYFLKKNIIDKKRKSR